MLLHAGLKQSLNLEEGEVLLVDKPLDWTSFDIVARIRAMFGIKKIGHAGTLDPKATGLLILCTGRMTKSIEQYMGWEKEYSGIIELGSVTKSFDTETEVVETKSITGITEELIEQGILGFVGIQLQLPPMYSAIKKNGRRLYKDARKGKEVDRPLREIEIREFEKTSWNPPLLGFRVVCSKGTYVRTLAHDLGQRLGCGGYLKELRRTRIGEFRVEQAIKVEELHTLEPKIITDQAKAN